MMKLYRFLFLLACVAGGGWLSAPAHALEFYEHELPRAAWPRSPTGDAVLRLPAVRNTLSTFKENGRIHIVIRYPGGDAGKQWADELRGWLVSFGVPLQYLELAPGAGGAARLVVEVADRDAGQTRAE